jgi:hypothetical protein
LVYSFLVYIINIETDFVTLVNTWYPMANRSATMPHHFDEIILFPDEFITEDFLTGKIYDAESESIFSNMIPIAKEISLSSAQIISTLCDDIPG